MQIKFRGNKLGVEKQKRQTNKGKTDFLVMPDSQEFVGIIKYLGDNCATDIKVGDKVYFGSDHQSVRINGEEICIMTDESVLAVVHEEQKENS